MANSVTSICNKAIRKIGIANRILNVETDTSKEASLCKTVYNEVIDQVLREYDWNFATIRKSLTKLTTETHPEFEDVFLLPTLPKILKFLSIENDIEYVIEEDARLYTNSSEAKIKYIGMITDTTKYDPIFVDLLATGIAIEIAPPTTSGERTLIRLREDYDKLLFKASMKDFQDSGQKVIRNSEWINARFEGSALEFLKDINVTT